MCCAGNWPFQAESLQGAEACATCKAVGLTGSATTIKAARGLNVQKVFELANYRVSLKEQHLELEKGEKRNKQPLLALIHVSNEDECSITACTELNNL